MELYNIYCCFWEGMKEISVGVCLNDYKWLEIWKKNGLFKKRPSEKKNLKKKYGLEQKQKEKKMKKEKK